MITWTNPSVGVGFIIALVVLIMAMILGFLKLMDLPMVLVVAAICAVRL